MPFDINVLVIEQCEIAKIPFKSTIQILNEIEHSDVVRYHSIYPFMTSMSGVWYELLKEEDGIIYASFADTDFDKPLDRIEKPYWVKNLDIIDGFTELIIKDEFIDEFERILEFLITQSPRKTIMFQSRYQSADEETICGVLSLSNFMDLLKSKKVLFNICYIIHD